MFALNEEWSAGFKVCSGMRLEGIFLGGCGLRA
jgi:hypothetical protein